MCACCVFVCVTSAPDFNLLWLNTRSHNCQYSACGPKNAASNCHALKALAPSQIVVIRLVTSVIAWLSYGRLNGGLVHIHAADLRFSTMQIVLTGS